VIPTTTKVDPQSDAKSFIHTTLVTDSRRRSIPSERLCQLSGFLMPVTREQFLSQVHPPLDSLGQPSSPTKSVFRVRWRELSEWNDFVSGASTYWSNLPNEEKSHVLPRVSSGYWEQQYETLTDSASSASQEPHLVTPFALLYSAPHNKAIVGSSDDHARILTQVPSNTVGQPDGSLQFDNQLSGIIELKSFWNLTETTILEVLQGLFTF